MLIKLGAKLRASAPLKLHPPYAIRRRYAKDGTASVSGRMGVRCTTITCPGGLLCDNVLISCKRMSHVLTAEVHALHMS